MITIKENRGFSLTFENGLTISVMIGTANYCARRDYSAPYLSEMQDQSRGNYTECHNAEIAIWNKDNKWLSIDHDQVTGWVPTEDVVEWINKVKNAKDLAELQAITPYRNTFSSEVGD
jgi:hypothetical protein